MYFFHDVFSFILFWDAALNIDCIYIEQNLPKLSILLKSYGEVVHWFFPIEMHGQCLMTGQPSPH